MTIDEFWSLIEKIDRDAGGDMDRKCELLTDELRKLPPAEVKAFSEHFDDCEDRAYTWELWAAAYIVGGGCSDDTFSDFRATLISKGRDTFERILANPEALADTDVNEDTAFYEGFQYPITEVYEEMTGELPLRAKPYPRAPSGKEFDEQTVGQLYPKLAEKHGFSG